MNVIPNVKIVVHKKKINLIMFNLFLDRIKAME